MDILNLSKQLKRKEISSKEIVKQCISNIEKFDPKYRFVITNNFEQALAHAEIVDNKRIKGFDLNILSGIPYTVKDNIMTKGIVSTSGSKIMKDFVPPYNATVINEINNKDGIILCKVNMDELGAGGETKSEFMQTLNPYNVKETVSGSSGGSAVSVLVDGGCYSLGSDTGGSVREPAEKCGLIGMKPTYGGISRYGVTAYANSLDQVGFIANTIEDIAILMEEVAKKDIKDVVTFERNYNNLLNKLNINKKIKVGYVKEIFDLQNKKELAFYFDFLKKLQKESGIQLVEISIPYIYETAGIYKTITSVEGASNFSKYDGLVYTTKGNGKTYSEIFTNSRKIGFSERVKTKIMMGNFLTKEENKSIVTTAYSLKDFLSNYFDETFLNLDTILLPMESFHENIYLTAISNIAETPAIQLPVKIGENNVPQGIQLIGKKYKDAELLGVAKSFHNIINFRGGLNA